MRARRWTRTLLLSVGLAAAVSCGQDATAGEQSDLESWFATELEYRIDRQWSVTGEGQLRLKNNLSAVDRHLAQIEAKFKAPAGFDIDGGIRFIRRNDTSGSRQGYVSQRRQHVSAAYGFKLGRSALKFRARYQSRVDLAAGDNETPDRHLRLRARIRHNFRNWKFDPDFGVELYRPVADDKPTGFDKLRLTLGTDWKAWHDGEIGVFYRYEKELGVESPQTTHILGLKLSFSVGGD